jgi:hypothetical protein
MSNRNQSNSTPHYVKMKSINSSIFRMPPSRICYSPDSPVHEVHQSIYHSHGDIIPLPSRQPLIGREYRGHSDAPLLSCPFRPTDVLLGTNLDCTEANRVG